MSRVVYKKRGFSLVEILIALSVISVLSMVSFNISNEKRIHELNKADIYWYNHLPNQVFGLKKYKGIDPVNITKEILINNGLNNTTPSGHDWGVCNEIGQDLNILCIDVTHNNYQQAQTSSNLIKSLEDLNLIQNKHISGTKLVFFMVFP